MRPPVSLRFAPLLLLLVSAFAVAIGCGAPPPAPPVDDEDATGITALFRTERPTTPGPYTIGEPCSETKACAEGLVCVYLDASHTQGYCSSPCTDVATRCGGTPRKTRALCMLQEGTEHYCGFICRIDHIDHDHKYPCPEKLTCSPTESAPDSHVYLCVPKPE